MFTIVRCGAGDQAPFFWLNVSELSGRAVGWNYDDLYRLINETVTSPKPADPTGGVTYTYDPVGNRLTRNSSLTGISNQNLVYDGTGDDRMTSDGASPSANYSYDLNGSVTQAGPSGSVTVYTYDSLARLTSVTAPSLAETFIYDGDGNKDSQTINGVTTNFLVDTHSLTGYAQVVDEIQNGSVTRTYTYGTSRISEDQFNGTSWNLSYFGYDGQGSVRYLMDSNGNITDQLDYDVFGTLINQTHVGTPTPNVYFYDGEQLDEDTGNYYLRARWMNPGIGRFQTMDTFEGDPNDPLTLHKYSFGSNNPENMIDPSGNEGEEGNPTINVQLPKWPANEVSNVMNAVEGIGWNNQQIQNSLYRECGDFLSGVDDVFLVYLDKAHVEINDQKWSRKYNLPLPPVQPPFLTAGQQKELTDDPNAMDRYNNIGLAVAQARQEDSNGSDPTFNAIYFRDRTTSSKVNTVDTDKNGVQHINNYDGFLHTQRHVKGLEEKKVLILTNIQIYGLALSGGH